MNTRVRCGVYTTRHTGSSWPWLRRRLVSYQDRLGCHRLRTGDQGQSLAELALLLPLLLLLASLILDGGRAVQTYMALVNAGREATLAGARGQMSDGDLTTIVRSELTRTGIDAAPATVAVSYTSTGLPPRQTVRVQITYAFTLIMPLPVDNLTLQTDAQMVAFW